MDTKVIATQIVESVEFIRLAHMEFPKSEHDMIRFHDRSTPYIVHPIFCAMAILAEPQLDENTRLIGYQALLFHDVLEDTTATLPTDINPEVKDLVQLMTFDSFQTECRDVWSRPPLIRLLKLYDKTSNLLDGSHMNIPKWNAHVDFTCKLRADVEANFGELNIVKISRAIAVQKV